MSPFLLCKSSSWSSWVKSGVRSLLIDDPVEMISGGDIGLLAPLDLIRNVMLSIVEGVISLSVWGDVRMAVLHWINLLGVFLLTHPDRFIEKLMR